jgi:DNA (cytosine-5)-methyltransferase 1
MSFGDIKHFTKSEIDDEELDSIIPDHDILTAGFPCQPSV